MPKEQTPTQQELFNWKHRLIKQNRPFFNGLPENLKEALRVYKYMGYQEINKFLRAGNPVARKIKPFGEFTLYKQDSIMTRKHFEEYTKAVAGINNNTTLGELTEIIQKFHYGEYQEIIADIDKCFKLKAPHLTNPSAGKKTILYRGTYLPAKLVNKKPGTIITFGDYLSTALDPKVSFNFMKPTNKQNGEIEPVLLIIRGYDGRPYICLDWDAVETHKMDKLKFAPYSDEYEILLPRGCSFKLVKKYRTQDYNQYYNQDAIAIQQASNFYSDIADVPSDFLSRASVKAVITRPVELTILELEFVKCKPDEIQTIRSTDPGVLTGIDLFLGDIVPSTGKGRTSRTTKSKNTEKTNKPNKTNITIKNKSKKSRKQHTTKKSR